MHIKDILSQKHTCFSFEFFPPKTAAQSEELYQNIHTLKELRPSYISVTYGAGGSTRELTHDLVLKLHKETGFTIIPHLTCINHTRRELRDILDCYVDAGIENIMALRGDLPKEHHSTPLKEGFRYAAELVSFIKHEYPQLGIGVAGFPEGHPETPHFFEEMDHLKRKVDAGADYICTQLFFDNRVFYEYRELCQHFNINIPIIAGIMPITSRQTLNRLAQLAQGSRFPTRLLKGLNRATENALAERVGIHWSTEQVRDLLDNDVKGIHFYTLNKSKATQTIYNNLGVHNSDDFQSRGSFTL